jgi:ornithine carbamoyltransferase
MADLTQAELLYILGVAHQLKTGKIAPQCPRTLGLIFYKASTRTRVSFSSAMFRLGGHVLDLPPGATQVGRGEPIADTARVLARYIDAVAIRTFEQQDIVDFAHYADIPIINALTDLEHPCQILADLQTLQENFGQLSGLTLTYLGDGNNIAHSLLLGCALAGVNVRIASPEGYLPSPSVVAQAEAIAAGHSEVVVTADPVAASQGAHALYTDVWASMGQEDSANSRIPIFQPYQLNQDLLAHADPEAIVLHCLPAHRGEEITDQVMEGKQSRLWDQAENRMHAQQAWLAAVLGAL